MGVDDVASDAGDDLVDRVVSSLVAVRGEPALPREAAEERPVLEIEDERVHVVGPAAVVTPTTREDLSHDEHVRRAGAARKDVLVRRSRAQAAPEDIVRAQVAAVFVEDEEGRVRR